MCRTVHTRHSFQQQQQFWMTTTISIHLANCQKTKYLDVCDELSLALSCPCISIYLSYIYIYVCICVWLPSSTSLEKEEREMEKINVNNQMDVYELIWYIPFEDWSFDDIIYTLVGSIVTVCFFLSLQFFFCLVWCH